MISKIIKESNNKSFFLYKIAIYGSKAEYYNEFILNSKAQLPKFVTFKTEIEK